MGRSARPPGVRRSRATIEFGNPASASRRRQWCGPTRCKRHATRSEAVRWPTPPWPRCRRITTGTSRLPKSRSGRRSPHDPRDGTARGRLALLLAARGRLRRGHQRSAARRATRSRLIAERHGAPRHGALLRARLASGDRLDGSRHRARAATSAGRALGRGLALGASGRHDEAIAQHPARARHRGERRLGGRIGRDVRQGRRAVSRTKRWHACAVSNGRGTFVSIDNYAYIARLPEPAG